MTVKKGIVMSVEEKRGKKEEKRVQLDNISAYHAFCLPLLKAGCS